jgi:hypothetical protein
MFSGIWDGKTTRGGHLLTKGEQYRQLGADYVIDDYLKHCVAGVQEGTEAVLFGNFPWNQSDKLPEGVARCKDWVAVLEHFRGKEA